MSIFNIRVNSYINNIPLAPRGGKDLFLHVKKRNYWKVQYILKEIDDITLEKAKRSDTQAFRLLYAHYSPFVWRLCFRSSNGDMNCAQEIMQNAFIKAHRYIGSFSKEAAFSTWLYKIAYNCINEYYSKAFRYNEGMVRLEDEYAASADMEGESNRLHEDKDLVTKILASLSETERFILTAREVDGVPYEELAKIIGIKESALRTKISRLKAEIRKRVDSVGMHVKNTHRNLRF